MRKIIHLKKSEMVILIVRADNKQKLDYLKTVIADSRTADYILVSSSVIDQVLIVPRGGIQIKEKTEGEK